MRKGMPFFSDNIYDRSVPKVITKKLIYSVVLLHVDDILQIINVGLVLARLHFGLELLYSLYLILGYIYIYIYMITNGSVANKLLACYSYMQP